jgi:hypothetical protein
MGTSSSQPSEEPHAHSRLSARNPIASATDAMLRGSRSSAAAVAATAASADAENQSSGSSASAASVTPPISPKISPPLYCFIKAKTRIHNSNKVVRRSAWYEAKQGSSMLIGRGEVCNLKLDDDRCALVNARLAPSTNVIPPAVVLTPEARTYRLVGMGLKRHADSNVIALGSVIKVGSVSLEVTGLCTDENDDFAERFGVEINTGYGGTGRRSSTSSSVRNGECCFVVGLVCVGCLVWLTHIAFHIHTYVSVASHIMSHITYLTSTHITHRILCVTYHAPHTTYHKSHILPLL